MSGRCVRTFVGSEFNPATYRWFVCSDIFLGGHEYVLLMNLCISFDLKKNGQHVKITWGHSQRFLVPTTKLAMVPTLVVSSWCWGTCGVLARLTICRMFINSLPKLSHVELVHQSVYVHDVASLIRIPRSSSCVRYIKKAIDTLCECWISAAAKILLVILLLVYRAFKCSLIRLM